MSRSSSGERTATSLTETPSLSVSAETKSSHLYTWELVHLETYTLSNSYT